MVKMWFLCHVSMRYGDTSMLGREHVLVSKDTHLGWLIWSLIQGVDDGFNPQIVVAWVGGDDLGVAWVGGWSFSWWRPKLGEVMKREIWWRQFSFGEVKKKWEKCKGKDYIGFRFWEGGVNKIDVREFCANRGVMCPSPWPLGRPWGERERSAFNGVGGSWWNNKRNLEFGK